MRRLQLVSTGAVCHFRSCPHASSLFTRRVRSVRSARDGPIEQKRIALYQTRACRTFTTQSGLSNKVAERDTIYALSTAAGRAAIAVIRVSGPACLKVYHALCPDKASPNPRAAIVRALYEPKAPPSHDTVLDSSALLLYFAGPASATGEDVLELHVHGGPAIVKAVLAAIPRCTDTDFVIRYAEPGEFTHRAFLNGRLDLTQVEALSDALAAETEQQRRMSMRATGGALATLYEEWRRLLLYARGELEALIDFSEDQHFDESPAELCVSIADQVRGLICQLEVHCQNAVRGEMLRNGISVSLLGAPNAGKSSLLNRIIGREAAIVSHEAGTTRDIVEVGIDLGGYLCRLGDTAGLRKRQDTSVGPTAVASATTITEVAGAISQIEHEGMRRAKARAAQSDVVIVVLSFESVDGPSGAGQIVLRLDEEVCSTAVRLVQEKGNVIVIVNKTDLLPSSDRPLAQNNALQSVLQSIPGLSKDAVHFMSCQEAEALASAGGVQNFLSALIRHFARLTAAASATIVNGSAQIDASVWQESLGATERHRILLETCLEHLRAFMLQVHGSSALLGTVDGSPANSAGAQAVRANIATPAASNMEAELDIVAAAEDLRAAANCLSRITGRGTSGDVEDVLGVVFEKFCVGK